MVMTNEQDTNYFRVARSDVSNEEEFLVTSIRERDL